MTIQATTRDAGGPQPYLDEQVELAKQEWEVALDALPQLICLIDEHGHLLRANRTVERWRLGRVTELKGKELHSLLHPQCDGVSCAVKTFLATCLAGRLECSIEIDDHRLGRYIVINAQPTMPRQRVIGKNTAIIIEDITRQKQVEESLRKTNEALSKAVVARQEMLQNVSHELRTPLTLIQGYASLLADESMGELSGEQREAIAIITAQNYHLHMMIDRLLLLQTLDEQKVQLSPCCLDVVAQQRLQEWQPRAAEKGVHLLWDDGNDVDLQVMANADLLAEALNNLVDNAIKFSPRDAAVRIRTWRTHQEAHVAIVDQGIGIAPQKQAEIFEHFYQVNGSSTRSVGGLGIGLGICKRIVSAHGGRLEVESPGEGHGSTFVVVLPLVG